MIVHCAVLLASTVVIEATVTDPEKLKPGTKLSAVDETLLELLVADTVFDVLEENNIGLELKLGSLTTVDRVRSSLAQGVREWIPSRDAWGRPLHMLLDENEDVVLISYGPDGVPDRDYEHVFLEDDTEWPGDETSSSDDILFQDGETVDPPDPPSQLTRALADIRAIGTAIESYAVDTNAYPSTGLALITLSGLSSVLAPLYIKELPSFDPWGYPYLIVASQESYVVLCTGSDGSIDANFNSALLLAGDNTMQSPSLPATDIVFANGQFVRFPVAPAPKEDGAASSQGQSGE